MTADDLFGNEAAEDEDERVFHAHLLTRDDLLPFDAPSNAIRIAMAYKGQGKSSLLRSLATRLKRSDDALVINITGAAVAPEISGHDPVKWARAWKRELYKLIALKFGAEIGFAWDDDSISLVEEAEKEGFRRRNIFSAIYDRLKPSVKVSAKASGVGLDAQLERVRLPISNHEEVVRRYLTGDVDQLWLIVDDIDRNFRATKSEKAKIVGFFDAIRDMRNAIPQLRVRTSIRPNVYTSVRLEFESISHIRQYLMQISWTEEQISEMLAKRIEGYLVRSAQLKSIDLAVGKDQRDHQLISLLFETPVRWGESTKPIPTALYTFSVGRPRWLIELCKRAAARAFKKHDSKITIEHIRNEMEDFGEARKSDLIAEFGAQCDQLADMFDAFHSKMEIYTTESLYQLIEEQILSKFSPSIAGLSGKARVNDVASFLFEVGLFNGRRDAGEKYEHLSFHQRPNAFKSLIGSEPSMRWEIHPAFRTALGLRPGY
ncbi:hypothetical protein VDQ16_16080 [Xanthomonas campestris pv. campestris]|uniref:P-loop ATPase, Sll1717 family n=1 Tax=Xanthomonas campestris TaxID=339 RepID=UPI0012FE2B7B|nr:hypothetical protein [Xanthomonas campestris]MEB1261620.1 hypothetical protein [Xanthomonas campestris pv. campestris]MEB1323878.1 hypothetical protein [Xanthomonas campestris pv. campestris]MEB1423419.1 hypothetical protein [Xanthomonas campestris pv. campestris]MEB1448282.1 hypothetical protein [Xanthomonas campestris pv. campestris]MEB1635444.1 hypothetical protein [Xanthomonas campestris pv. campestris]